MTIRYIFQHIVQYVQYIRIQTEKHFSKCQLVTINVTLSIQACETRIYYSSRGNSHDCYARCSEKERGREEEGGKDM